MSFNDCDGAMTGLFFSLENDGDKATVVFLGEPIPKQGTYKGKPRTQHCFAVATEEGTLVWTVGNKLYRRLRDGWKTFTAKAVCIIRHGEKDDPSTKYELTPTAIPTALRKALPNCTLDVINDMLDSAKNFDSDSPEG